MLLFKKTVVANSCLATSSKASGIFKSRCRINIAVTIDEIGVKLVMLSSSEWLICLFSICNYGEVSVPTKLVNEKTSAMSAFCSKAPRKTFPPRSLIMYAATS